MNVWEKKVDITVHHYIKPTSIMLYESEKTDLQANRRSALCCGIFEVSYKN